MNSPFRGLAALILLGSAASASSALALQEAEVDYEPGNLPGTSDVLCNYTINYGDPEPDLKPGEVLCFNAINGGFSSTPSAYSYPPDKTGGESSLQSVCKAPARRTLGGLVAPGTTTTSTTNQPFEATWRVGRHYGGDLFGAGAFVNAYLRAEPATAIHQDRVATGASVTAAATVFGSTDTLFEVGADADAEYGQQAHISGRVIVLGETRWSDEREYDLSISESTNLTLLSASMNFQLGPVPILVTGEVKATFGIEGAYGPDLSQMSSGFVGVAGEAMPYAELSAVARAGIGGKILGVDVSAGVQGSLTLIRMEAPSNGYVLVSGQRAVKWSLNSDLDLTTLNGELGLYARAGSRSWDLPIAQWDGYSTTIPLFHLSGCSTKFAN